MKPLYDILESLLDADFDIGDEVLTLKQAGYICTNMSCNDNWGRNVSQKACAEITGDKIDISQANRTNQNPYRGFADYVSSEAVYHAKVSAGRDGMGMGKWKFAWTIRILLDYCHCDTEEIKEMLTKMVATKHPFEVTVKQMRNKFIIKSTYQTMWGKGNMSMTLTRQ